LWRQGTQASQQTWPASTTPARAKFGLVATAARQRALACPPLRWASVQTHQPHQGGRQPSRLATAHASPRWHSSLLAAPACRPLCWAADGLRRPAHPQCRRPSRCIYEPVVRVLAAPNRPGHRSRSNYRRRPCEAPPGPLHALRRRIH